MTTEHSQADIAVLLDALRNEVRARRLALGGAEPDPLERDLQRALDEIELHRVVSAHWPLVGRSVPERAVALVNKLVRRYLRWYINPIVEQQNAFNDTVARTLRLLAEAYADLARQGRETGDGGRETGDGRREAGDGRRGEGETGRGGEGERRSEGDWRGEGGMAGQVGELQAEVVRRGALEPAAGFPDLELRGQELQLRLRQEVNAHWPLVGRSLPERAVALVNKLVRRYLRWYINPIVEQQNAANLAISAALLAAARLDAERRAQVAARRAAKRSP